MKYSAETPSSLIALRSILSSSLALSHSKKCSYPAEYVPSLVSKPFERTQTWLKVKRSGMSFL